MNSTNPTNHILLTIDVEDWFQVENFKQYIPFSSWPSRELCVEKNTHRLLDLLDSQRSEVRACPPSVWRGQKSNSTNPINSINSINSTNPINSPKATFFVLGWIAERLPNLVREIQARGHEVASHGYYHNLSNHQSYEDLKTDLTDSKKLLEDIIGAPIYGYRAPSFAINEDILKVIQDCGYLYDSSYNSFSMHGRYGQLSLSQNGKKGIALQIPAGRKSHPLTHYQQPATSNQYQSSIFNLQSSILFELPISNLDLRNPFSFQLSAFSSRQNAKKSFLFTSFALPWGGGAYFRLIPFPLFKLGVQSILKKQGAYLFYLHPWEIDPQQPKVKDAPAFFKFRHYVNLDKTHSKLLRLIQSFQHCHFITCSQYLSTLSCQP